MQGKCQTASQAPAKVSTEILVQAGLLPNPCSSRQPLPAELASTETGAEGQGGCHRPSPTPGLLMDPKPSTALMLMVTVILYISSSKQAV